MAKYTFQAIHPGQVFLVGERTIKDGDTVELSEAAVRAAVAQGVRFKETEPKAGEPELYRSSARIRGIDDVKPAAEAPKA